MQETLSCLPTDFPDRPDANSCINVVIAYEDFETGKRAKKTYDFLVENLVRDCQLTNQMWKFDVLTVPKLRQIAGADAAAADIVMISCHGDELPLQVKSWMETWLTESVGPRALVALFDGAREGARRTQAVRDYLADSARRGRMEFFAQPDQCTDSGQDDELVPDEREVNLSQRTLSTLAGVIRLDATGRCKVCD